MEIFSGRTARVVYLNLIFTLSAGAAQPIFTGLGDLPGGPFVSRANAVSADGRVVVGSSASATSEGSTEAFIWTLESGMVGMAKTGSPYYPRSAFGVSGNGLTVAGTGETPSQGAAWIWSSSTGFQEVGDLPGGGVGSSVQSLSLDGSTVVGIGSSDFNPGGEPYRWTAKTGILGLGDLEGGLVGGGAFGVNGDGSVVVGAGNSELGGEAFRWTIDEGMVGLGDLPGGRFQSFASAVSADGHATVGWSTSDRSFPNAEAMRWTAKTGMIGLGDLPGGSFASFAYGVSADGFIVVGRATIARTGGAPADLPVPFIWDEAHGMRDLQEVLVNDFGLDLTGWKLGTAYAISADGTTIVGQGLNPLGQSEAWLARIPEPATLALLALGATCFRRRRWNLAPRRTRSSRRSGTPAILSL